MLLGEHGGERAPLLLPAGTPPDGVFLPFLLGVTVPAHWAEVSGNAGLNAADLGVITPGEVVVEQAQLPGEEFERPAGAGKPGDVPFVLAVLPPSWRGHHGQH